MGTFFLGQPVYLDEFKIEKLVKFETLIVPNELMLSLSLSCLSAVSNKVSSRFLFYLSICPIKIGLDAKIIRTVYYRRSLKYFVLLIHT